MHQSATSFSVFDAVNIMYLAADRMHKVICVWVRCHHPPTLVSPKKSFRRSNNIHTTASLTTLTCQVLVKQGQALCTSNAVVQLQPKCRGTDKPDHNVLSCTGRANTETLILGIHVVCNDLVVTVNHEVQAKELKAMLPPHRVQLVEHCTECMSGTGAHLGHQVILNTELQNQLPCEQLCSWITARQDTQS